MIRLAILAVATACGLVAGALAAGLYATAYYQPRLHRCAGAVEESVQQLVAAKLSCPRRTPL